MVCLDIVGTMHALLIVYPDLPNWTYVFNVVLSFLCTCKIPNDVKYAAQKHILLENKGGCVMKHLKESICYFALKLWYGITHVCKTIPYKIAYGRWKWINWEAIQSILGRISLLMVFWYKTKSIFLFFWNFFIRLDYFTQTYQW